MGDINIAYNNIIAACNDPHIGYNMYSLRTTIKLGVAYDTYCDCSSLMSWGLTLGGFFSTNPWFSTHNERDKLTEIGFTEHGAGNIDWQAGDILWRSGHTEMVYKGSGRGGITMGAHTSNTSWDRQVSINSYRSSASSWTYLYRWPGGTPAGSYAWFQPSNQRYLSYDEMYNNAICFANYFSARGYTSGAIAGMLGNIEVESGINPNLWQDLTVGSGGYGLVQWDPASNYLNWASGQGVDINDADENGEGQCRWIDEETVPSGQWITTASYPETWVEYANLTNPDYASRCFGHNFERYDTATEQLRADKAVWWFNEILENFPNDPGNPPKDRLYNWLYGAMHFRRWTKLLP